jgi:DNA-binding beta-propeller fold protein YncE
MRSRQQCFGIIATLGLVPVLLAATVAVAAPLSITPWGGIGSGNGQFFSPSGVAVDAFGFVYVVDNGNHRVEKFGPIATTVSATSWGRLKTLYHP